MSKEISLHVVRTIKSEFHSGSTLQQIADKNNVSLSFVSRVSRGKCYKDVEWLVMIDLLKQCPECPFRGTQEILVILKREAKKRKGK